MVWLPDRSIRHIFCPSNRLVSYSRWRKGRHYGGIRSAGDLYYGQTETDSHQSLGVHRVRLELMHRFLHAVVGHQATLKEDQNNKRDH